MQLKKYEEARQRALEQRDAQNKQLEELKAKLLAEQAANKKEGAMIRKRAEQVCCCDDWRVLNVKDACVLHVSSPCLCH